MIPATGDVEFFLSTLLADFASQILWDFSNAVRRPRVLDPLSPFRAATDAAVPQAAQLESRTNIATPQETPGPPSPFTYISQKPTARSTISAYVAPASPTVREARSINLAPFGISPPPQSRTSLGMWGGSQSGNRDGFLYGMNIQSNMALQPGTSATPPPGGVLVDSKARRKVLGREKKLMADMWLLSGRLDEAISWCASRNCVGSRNSGTEAI